MVRALLTVIVLLACASGALAGGLKTIIHSPDVLETTRKDVILRQRTVMPAYRQLIEEAEQAMRAPAQTVIFKPAPPPGGDLHDYWSLAPDWWPDPKSRDGRPYKQHPGKPYPEAESNAYDKARLERMADEALTLALAYHLTGSEEYAGKGTALIWSWCCDSVTRMTPHLEFGHARPGIAHGTHTGIIETRHLIKAVEAAILLEPSAAWSDVVSRKVKAWFSDYLDWLINSRFGKQEAGIPGLHGVWFDAQAAVYALYVGKVNMARSIVGEVIPRRMIHTIEQDGSIPAELGKPGSRTAVFSLLQAMFILAGVGERVGIDLWHLSMPPGVSLKEALDFAEPWLAENSAWPHGTDRKYDPFDYVPLFHRAALVYDDARYLERLQDLPPEKLRTDRAQLFH